MAVPVSGSFFIFTGSSAEEVRLHTSSIWYNVSQALNLDHGVDIVSYGQGDDFTNIISASDLVRNYFSSSFSASTSIVLARW